MTTSPRYSAFISYCHDDERWAKWLQKALETWRAPKRVAAVTRLKPVFRDRSELSAAHDLSEIIQEALRQSESLIVICSPAAAQSRWVDEEIRLFRKIGRHDRIFPLIVAGEPSAGPGGEECFPPALREGVEPIAADARKDRDGKTDARLKLIAALVGVGFDELKRREQTRRNRRLAAAASVALFVAAGASALAVEALIQRNAAQQRQREAESLIGFMLTDLNQKLRPVQRLDILETVDQRALDYFRSGNNRTETYDTLLLRVKAVQKIGDVQQAQGKSADALESYRTASGLGAELVRRSPADARGEAAYGEALNHLGNVYWYQGNLDSAFGSFRSAVSLLETATAAQPLTASLAMLGSTLTNEGRVDEARSDFGAAQPLYDRVLAVFQQLAAREPQNPLWQVDVADAYDNLGKLALEQGQLSQAIADYRKVQNLKAQLFAKNPADNDIKERLLVSDAILGRTLVMCGARDAAAGYVRDAVKMASELVAYDPSQTYPKWDYAKYSLLLAGVVADAGQVDEAARLNGESLRVFGDLVKADPSRNALRRELATAQIETARFELARHNMDRATSLADAAGETIEAERKRDPRDRDLLLLAAQSEILSGQLAERRGDAMAARSHWRRAYDAIQGPARAGADPNFLAALATSLLLAGDSAGAQPVLKQLESAGYQMPGFQALLVQKKQPYRANTEGCVAE